MEDTLILEGKTYVSSKRAAEITGYANDYVGQLCRAGKVNARRVGRTWYVEEDSIREHNRNSVPGGGSRKESDKDNTERHNKSRKTILRKSAVRDEDDEHEHIDPSTETPARTSTEEARSIRYPLQYESDEGEKAHNETEEEKSEQTPSFVHSSSEEESALEETADRDEKREPEGKEVQITSYAERLPSEEYRGEYTGQDKKNSEMLDRSKEGDPSQASAYTASPKRSMSKHVVGGEAKGTMRSNSTFEQMPGEKAAAEIHSSSHEGELQDGMQQEHATPPNATRSSHRYAALYALAILLLISILLYAGFAIEGTATFERS